MERELRLLEAEVEASTQELCRYLERVHGKGHVWSSPLREVLQALETSRQLRQDSLVEFPHDLRDIHWRLGVGAIKLRVGQYIQCRLPEHAPKRWDHYNTKRQNVSATIVEVEGVPCGVLIQRDPNYWYVSTITSHGHISLPKVELSGEPTMDGAVRRLMGALANSRLEKLLEWERQFERGTNRSGNRKTCGPSSWKTNHLITITEES
jgi:hypothetical protein